jgi:hypothetical protein
MLDNLSLIYREDFSVDEEIGYVKLKMRKFMNKKENQETK